VDQLKQKDQLALQLKEKNKLLFSK
jgi:hypothetical protein